jgi:hypothetical protein
MFTVFVMKVTKIELLNKKTDSVIASHEHDATMRFSLKQNDLFADSIRHLANFGLQLQSYVEGMNKIASV